MKKHWFTLFVIPLLFGIILYAYVNQRPALYVFMWSGYIKPSLIEAFEEKYHCRILSDSYDSNEALFAKLKFGGSGYDIVFPSLYFVDPLKKQGYIESIPKEKIPNLRYIDHNLLSHLGVQESPDGVPFLISFSGILYRSDRIHKRINSWNIFANPAYKGRMTLLNDIREGIGAALRVCGYSANSTSPSELEGAKRVLLIWKKNLAKFEGEQHKNGVASGEFLISDGYASDCFQISKEHPEVRFCFPKEGSLVTIDYACVSSHSKHKELAYQFINYLLDPENSAQNMIHTGGRAPNISAKSFLPENLRSSPLFYPEENPQNTFECLFSVDSAQKLYSQIWDEVRNTNSD